MQVLQLKAAPLPASYDPCALEHWLTLMLVPGMGPASANKLLRAFGSPQGVLSATGAQLRPLVSEALSISVLRARLDQATAVEQQLAYLRAQASHVRIFTLADADYPKLLLQAPNPPPLLWACGNLKCLERPALAIVGSRAATQGGQRTAEEFAASLGGAGLCIVSGLALGIDAAAHTGALETPGGTIAVLGCGINHIYPRRNRALFQRIPSHGLLLSEQPAGTSSRPSHFPQRNRLIAALCSATLVVEAARDSGSLITAKLALDMGRDVMAIPGSIHSPHSKGCHWLIKQGAKLVENAQDVLDELPMLMLQGSPVALPTPSASLPEEPACTALQALGYDPISLEQLQEGSAYSAAHWQAELLGLELAGRIERLPDGRYLRLPLLPIRNK